MRGFTYICYNIFEKIKMQNIFKDLKVIDVSTVLAGPSVATFFAELGARVLKIESPNPGDVTRSWKLPSEDHKSNISAYFSSVNYKKTYLKLNHLDQEHYALFSKHLKDADLIIMNFKKDDYKKLKVDDASLRKVNSRLIIGKITAFGNESDRIAYDLILQAESGFMSLNGEENQAPMKMPVALIDVLAAHHLKEGLLLALLDKKPRTISVSLYDAAVCSLMNQASNFLMTGEVPKKQGNLHPNIAPYGELFHTLDQELITFAIGSDKHFSLLCELLGLEGVIESKAFLSNQERVKNRIHLKKIISEKVGLIQSKIILRDCLDLGIPCAKITGVEEVLKSSKSQSLLRKELIEGKETIRLTSLAAQWK